MTIVKSKTLIALSTVMAALTAYSLVNLVRVGVGEDGRLLFSLGVVNDILGGILAVSIFLGRRAAIKWFYASAAGALAVVPLLGLRHPEFPIWMLIFVFLSMAIVCAIVWAILMWKREALNQPAEQVTAHA